MIETFTKTETRFLSNFYPYKNKDGDKYPHVVTIKYKGLTFDCVENAYMASKAKNKKDVARFVQMTPFESKKFVSEGGLEIRDGWDKIKVRMMTNFVRQKFTNNQDLARMLIATGDQKLIEGNDWGDVFWGVCDGVGKNNLGKILMKIRKELGAR